MATKWQRVRIDIPERFGPAERQSIASEIVRFIQKRTAQGKNITGGNFAAYSTAYKKSLDFKNAGKSSKVNIRLSGDTLAALEALSHQKGSILIGYENGTDENAIADGNIRGTYGRSKAISGKARNFLGITQSDLNSKVLSKFESDSEKKAEEIRQREKEAQEAAGG